MINHLDQPIVFCDVETTGTSPRNSRVTEIACIRYEQGHEVDRFVSLINPEQPIPYNIQRITGITNQMVARAPTFPEITNQIKTIFDGAVLCAHNARFDYSFIKTELSNSGLEFSNPSLCTVQISRQLFPEHRSHSLSNIIKRYGFSCNARHRALGDTEILVDFAKYIENNCAPESITQALNTKKTPGNIPPNLDKSKIDNLPTNPGVYTFKGSSNEILYIGKSINIRNRVRSHFSNSLHDVKSKKIWREVHDIEYSETASDLGAQLLELHQIKTVQPIYNRKSRRLRKLWYLRKINQNNPYTQLAITPSSGLAIAELPNVYGIFRTKQKASDYLRSLVKNHGLCPKLLGVESGNSQCFSNQLGICRGACINNVKPAIYNNLLEGVLNGRRVKLWPYSGQKELLFQNSDINLTDRVIVDNWILKSAEIINSNGVSQSLLPTDNPTFDYEMYKVLARYL